MHGIFNCSRPGLGNWLKADNGATNPAADSEAHTLCTVGTSNALADGAGKAVGWDFFFLWSDCFGGVGGRFSCRLDPFPLDSLGHIPRIPQSPCPPLPSWLSSVSIGFDRVLEHWSPLFIQPSDHQVIDFAPSSDVSGETLMMFPPWSFCLSYTIS